MAKFCTRCGKTLEEGKACECVSTMNTPVNQTNGTSNIDFNRGFNDYIDIIKGIFVKPADTIKAFTKSNKGLLGGVAILINCLVTGLFFYFFCSKSMTGLMSLFMGGYGSYSSYFSSALEVPFARTFFMGFLFVAAWFLVAALIILLFANPIFKDKMDIKKAFALVGTCSVFTTLTTVLAIVCTFISIPFTIVVLLLGAGFYLTHLYQGLSDSTNINKNKLIYVFMPAVALATFVMVYIVPKFFS